MKLNWFVAFRRLQVSTEIWLRKFSVEQRISSAYLCVILDYKPWNCVKLDSISSFYWKNHQSFLCKHTFERFNDAFALGELNYDYSTRRHIIILCWNLRYDSNDWTTLKWRYCLYKNCICWHTWTRKNKKKTLKKRHLCRNRVYERIWSTISITTRNTSFFSQSHPLFYALMYLECFTFGW